MKEKEKKYVELLLKRCMNLKKDDILFIDYDVANQAFVDELKDYAISELKVKEVFFHKTDIYEVKDFLKKAHKEDIKNNDMFDGKIWDTYAKKGAAFLMIASEFPKVLEKIDTELIAEVSRVKMETKPVYKQMQKDNELTWLIAVYPNKVWAKEKFPDLEEEEAYKKLFDLMMEVTLCNESDPIESWNKNLKEQQDKMQKLNDLEITSLHYTNELGTDLTVKLSKKAVWQSAGSDNNRIIVNMPSYEVFTTPDYRETEGIVYASKPLVYNSSLIEDFWVEFKKGKVVKFDAKKGKDLLEKIIKGDEGSSRLGEVALVGKSSPIAKTNFVFGETCLDENASCHIALGAGFTECLDGSVDMDEEEQDKNGLNISQNHVDFMIGTDDLCIEAETKEGTKEIFKDGEFNL